MPTKDVILANSIRKSALLNRHDLNTYVRLSAHITEIDGDPSLATQAVADAFVALAASQVGTYSALAGLLKILKINPATANSTMVTVVNLFGHSADRSVAAEAQTIRKLISRQRPDLAQLAKARC